MAQTTLSSPPLSGQARAMRNGAPPHGSEFAVEQPWRSNTSTPLRWILSHLKRNKLLIALVFIGAAGNALLAAALPVLTGVGFNAVLQGDTPDMRRLLWVALAIVGSQLIRGVLQLGRNFGSEVLGQRLERDARQELYGVLLGKSMAFHDTHATGDLMARATNDVRELALMMAPGFNLVLGSANFLIVPLIISPTIHPALLLTPALFAVTYVIAIAAYLRQLDPITSAVRGSFGLLNAGLTESIEGIETVKGAAQERSEAMRFKEYAQAFRDAFVNQGRVEARFLPLLFFGLAQGFAFWHAIVLYQQGSIVIGDIVAYVGLISLFGFPVFVSIFSYSQASAGFASARRILDLLNARTELDLNAEGVQQTMRGRVEFRSVSFAYNADYVDERLEAEEELFGVNGHEGTDKPQTALDDISFAIEPGQTLALVGQTGAGKSTIAKLLNRTYDADEGSILIDDIDVRDWHLASLRQQISIIEQDIFLFSRTIGENIAFGAPDATTEQIEEAAKSAQAHEFILTFPDGYDTVIGERGVMLSGGQRQRLALARAFLTNPAILVLDDSTSAIDSATEDKIQRAIEAATRGRTTILITHRLSQIRWADKIVVLKKGRVVAVGAHEELMQSSTAYQNIFARF